MDLYWIESALENEGEMLDFWRSLSLRPGFELSLKHLEGLSPDSVKNVIDILQGLDDDSADYRLKCPPFMPGYQLMRSYLEDVIIDEDSGMKAFDIDTRWADLGEELAGLVYRSVIGRYIIVVNRDLEELVQDALAQQELRRILEDRPPQQLSLIGLDAVNHLEPEVDDFVEAIFSIRF